MAAELHAPRLRDLPRSGADPGRLADAAQLLARSRRPLIVAGGGVHYAGACEALAEFASRNEIPVAETQAGKGALAHDHRWNAGAIGVTGAESANRLAADADLLLLVGTRLQDFTTGSGALFRDAVRPVVAINVARHDAVKYGALALDGLKFALVIRSGRVMAEGGWVFACVVDDAADAAQRKALAAIASGEAGGRPAVIRTTLVKDFRGVEFRPIAFESEGLRRRTEIPGVLAYEIEGVVSRNGSGEPYYIDNVAHSAGRRLALARSKETHLHGFGLALDMAGAGNNAHYAPFSWSS